MSKPSRLYVPVYTNLADHPKTRRLSRLLNIATPYALGHLVQLWLWAQEYAADGDLTAFAPDEIAWAAGFEDDPEIWLRALEKSGFVEDGQLHDWNTYAGRIRAQRENNAERQAKWREKRSSDSTSNCDVTVTSQLDNCLSKEEEEDKEKVITPLPPRGGQEAERAASIYTSDFDAFWSVYPRGRGDKMTAFTVWKRLSPQHKSDAMAALPLWVACRQWQDGYFPACSKWLRGHGWEDDPPKAPAANGHRRIEARDNYVAGQFETKDKGGWTHEDGTMKQWHEL